MSTRALERAVTSWNRSRLYLDSDEVLAQILDRGDLAAWRELYALVLGVVGRVPLPFPAYWRAARMSLGERVDWSAPPPADLGIA